MRTLYPGARARVGLLVLAALVASGGGATQVAAQDACATAADGALCPDDQDPCTMDRCGAGVCRHEPVVERITCDPVSDAYRRTLGLSELIVELRDLVALRGLPEGPRSAAELGLGIVAQDLQRASDALAGRLPLPDPGIGQTLAQVRARAALDAARASPPLVRTAMRAIKRGAPDLARRARFLYRSTNRLKRELRRLQRVSSVFVR